MRKLSGLLNSLSVNKQRKIFVAGDFNIDLLKTDNHELITSFSSYSLWQ